MSFYWSVIKMLLEFFAPRASDVVAAVAALKAKPLPEQLHRQPLDARLAELQKALTVQAEIVEQATKQLADVQKALERVTIATVVACLLAIVAAGLFLMK
jgi:hypothetical protein